MTKKAFVEIEEMTETIIKFVNSGKYKDFVDTINGDTKEDGFRGALFIMPSVILSNCEITYVDQC